MSETNEYEKRKQELELQKLELEIEQLQHGTKDSKKIGRSERFKLLSTLAAVVIPLLVGMGTMFVQLTSQMNEIKREKTKNIQTITQELTQLSNMLVQSESIAGLMPHFLGVILGLGRLHNTTKLD